jgi:hypothetical protein
MAIADIEHARIEWANWRFGWKLLRHCVVLQFVREFPSDLKVILSLFDGIAIAGTKGFVRLPQ